MKKSKRKKIAFIVAITLVVLGIVGVISGISLGVKHNEMFHWKWYPYDDEMLNEAIADEAIDFATIHNLDIEANGIDIAVVYGDSNAVLLDKIAKKDVSLQQNGDTLKIAMKHHRRYKNAKITIYLAKDTILEDMQLDANASQVNLHQLKINNLKMNVNASDVTMDKMNIFHKFKLEIAAGSLNGDLEEANLIHIDSDISDVKLAIAQQQETYNYKIENNLGDIQFGNMDLEGVSEQENYDQNKEHFIELEGNASTIDILFTALAI